jgi:hypothetical protein
MATDETRKQLQRVLLGCRVYLTTGKVVYPVDPSMFIDLKRERVN